MVERWEPSSAPPTPAKKRAHAERKHLVAEHVDAHDPGGDFVIAYAAHDVAVIAEQEPPQHYERKERPYIAREQTRVAGYTLNAQ